MSRASPSSEHASPTIAASADAFVRRQGGADAKAWVDAIRAGDFESAWRINDVEVQQLRGGDKHSGPRHLQHIWDGSSLQAKRVLVRCYHGLGDTIQFARFLAPLRKLAREVVVWGQPALMNLLGRVEGVDRVLPLHDATPDVPFDLDIEIMELGHALRVTPHDLWKGAYLNSEMQSGGQQRRVRRDRRSLAVGLAWKSGDWDTRRSLPLSAVTRLGKEPAIEFHSLQLETPTESAACQINQDLDVSSIDALLSTMHQLDLVISVDTMAAHLAGAAGLETWTLLIEDCDWRWPLRGSKTLWYPTMRLFHQRRAGDWETMVDSVLNSLRQRVEIETFGERTLAAGSASHPSAPGSCP